MLGKLINKVIGYFSPPEPVFVAENGDLIYPNPSNVSKLHYVEVEYIPESIMDEGYFLYHLKYIKEKQSHRMIMYKYKQKYNT